MKSVAEFYFDPVNTAFRLQKNTTDFKNQWLSNWWAHQDLNLGPKDYEQPQEIKIYINQ
jgi:hypothetical protein